MKTTTLTGYHILHNYSVVDADAWTKLCDGPGVDPKQAKLVTEQLNDVRHGHYVSGIFTRSLSREFEELQTFTTVLTEHSEVHQCVGNTLREAQGLGIVNKVRSRDQNRMPTALRGNVPVPSLELVRVAAQAARRAAGLPCRTVVPPLAITNNSGGSGLLALEDGDTDTDLDGDEEGEESEEEDEAEKHDAPEDAVGGGEPPVPGAATAEVTPSKAASSPFPPSSARGAAVASKKHAASVQSSSQCHVDSCHLYSTCRTCSAKVIGTVSLFDK